MQNINEEQFKRRLIGNLMNAGTRNLKLSKKQEMKLQEWIVPYLNDEFKFSSEPLKIKDIRIFIDRWESSDLNATEANDTHKHDPRTSAAN